MRKKIITIYILLLGLIFAVGCDDGDPIVNSVIQYRVTCDIESDLTIEYNAYNSSFGNYSSKIYFYGDNWQSEFNLWIAQPESKSFTPKIYVKNNTDTDTKITVEIFIDGILKESGSVAGPYAEIKLKGKKIDSPDEGFWD